MSSLISSFLIEPVVRQARRFSRPSISSIDTPRQSSDRRHLNDEVAAPQVQVLPAAVTGEILGDTDYEELRNGTHDVSISRAIPGQPLVSSPTAVDGGLDAELEALEETRPGIVSALSRTSIRPSTSQRDLNRLDEETPNPLYGIPERFRSTNTSFSNSIHSLVEAQEGSPRRTTGQDSVRSLAGSYNSRIGNGTLPEDDGMGALRKRIVEIREMLVSNPEKARLMHDLMTEQHNSSQASLHALHVRGPRSPSSLLSLDKPLTPNSTNSSVENNTGDPFTPMSLSSAVDPLNPYNLDERALEPTFVPSPTPPIMSTDPIAEADEQESDDEEIATLGCPHYKRNVKLQCSACNRWYTCRFCHDEVEDHSLNRKETKNMLCMLCRCPQPAAEHCSECGERAAWYYCAICKLWDNDNEKSIYHCNDCGICRLGQGLGKDFYHCKKCCVCMSISIATSHRCIERSTDCDCPICGEYMFTSPQTVVFMRCGHSIHHKCYYEYMKSSYRCPICSRSIVNMEMQFRNLDRAIESQPMPSQFRDTKALVYCNDCAAKTSVDYHWLGLKCAVCDSYNTAQIQILSGPDPQSQTTPHSEVASHPPGPSDLIAFPPTGIYSPSRGRHTRSIPASHLSTPSSSGRRPTSSASAMESARYSPYPIPQRAGRSVSPFRSFGGDLIRATAATAEEAEPINTDDEEEEEVDFWGGGTRSRSRSALRDTDEQGSPEDDDDSIEDNDEDTDEEDGDDGDANDQMELLGHR